MESAGRHLNEKAIVVDGHNHIMKELAQRRSQGEKALFLLDCTKNDQFMQSLNNAYNEVRL